jgi:NitT/TauT family transport system substrate-binding protein
LLAAGLFAPACGDSSDSEATATGTASATVAASSTAPGGALPLGTPADEATLRLGYFPNVTHAPAIVGLNEGLFAEALGANVTVETTTFNAGPSVIEALFAGEIDISFIGPNPAINGFVQSEGEALRIIGGSTSAGALFVVHPDSGIEQASDLSGKKVVTPQLGNTQDVALRAWLKANGLDSRENGGDVEVIPTANADALSLFLQGEIDGAWVPEPWGTRLIQEAGGRVFVDERDLWPNGDFVTTHVIVRTAFLEEHPDVVAAFLRGLVSTIEFIDANQEDAKQVTNDGIEAITSAALPQEVIDGAWGNLRFTWDPISSSLLKSALDAHELGYIEDEPNLDGIYALDLLNQVLAESGKPAVQ